MHWIPSHILLEKKQQQLKNRVPIYLCIYLLIHGCGFKLYFVKRDMALDLNHPMSHDFIRVTCYYFYLHVVHCSSSISVLCHRIQHHLYSPTPTLPART